MMQLIQRAAFRDDQRHALRRVMPLLRNEALNGDEYDARAFNLLKAADEAKTELAELPVLDDQPVTLSLRDLLAIRGMVGAALAHWRRIERLEGERAQYTVGFHATRAKDVAFMAQTYASMLEEFGREVIDPTVAQLCYGRLASLGVQIAAGERVDA